MSVHLPSAVGIICLLVWSYLLLARGGFWRVSLRDAPPSRSLLRVVAIVPARNEADVIGRSLSSLLGQQGLDLHVVLVDDNSSDDTPVIAQTMGNDHPGRISLVRGKPLARGWSGKVWALQQGVEVAQSFAPDFFLLTDADIEHAPQNVARLLAIAEEGKYSLASFMVKLQCQTLAERLLIPAFVFFFFMLYPPHWVQDPRRSIAGAAGGCILTRPDVLAKAGGLAAIRGEIIDDCSLAGAVKRSGGTVWLGLANTAVSIRPYRSFGEIARMISRTAFNQLDHSVFLLIVAILGLLLVYVAPVVLLIMPGRSSMVFGGIAFAVMTLAYAPMVRYYGLNPLWALTLPVAAIFYMGATIRSAMRYWRGRGGDWKGRLQDHAHAD